MEPTFSDQRIPFPHQAQPFFLYPRLVVCGLQRWKHLKFSLAEFETGVEARKNIFDTPDVNRHNRHTANFHQPAETGLGLVHFPINGAFALGKQAERKAFLQDLFWGVVATEPVLMTRPR